MRVNSHCHVFNLQAVAGNEAFRNLEGRAIRYGVPEPIAEALCDVVKFFIRTGRPADQKAVKRKLAGNHKIFRAVTERQRERKDIEHMGSPMLDQLLREACDNDAQFAGVTDFIEFIQIGLLPTMDDVTDHLMETLEEDESAVALMMDIRSGRQDEEESDEKRFRKQVRQTIRQVYRYPGRVLPFYAVNPLRTDFVRKTKKALKDHPFVGVKLYPSLGYSVNADGLHEIYDYCAENDLPITMHCNGEGFCRDDASVANANPFYWTDILEKTPKLKVCFAHFGGDEKFSRAHAPKELKADDKPDAWAGSILHLMEKYPGKVFADISFHTAPMGEKGDAGYFAKLKGLIEDEHYQRRILWGSDHFLIQMRISEENYREFFEKYLDDRSFKQIAEENPLNFLGLRTDNLGANIRKYVGHLVEKVEDVAKFHESKPPSWLVEAVREYHPELAERFAALAVPSEPSTRTGPRMNLPTGKRPSHSRTA